jgi:hypothetical protein
MTALGCQNLKEWFSITFVDLYVQVVGFIKGV